MTDKNLHLDKTSTSALVKEEKLSKPEAEKSFFPLIESLKLLLCSCAHVFNLAATAATKCVRLQKQKTKGIEPAETTSRQWLAPTDPASTGANSKPKWKQALTI